MEYKPDWPAARSGLIRWWRRQGMAITVIPQRDVPRLPLAQPQLPEDPETLWADRLYRGDQAEWYMSEHDYLAEAFPYFDTLMGPGSLGIMLGAVPRFAPDTVWYEPCIADPEAFGPIRFEPDGNLWFRRHMELIDEGLKRSNGRYLVGIPDLVENVDTLAAMRGNIELLYDLTERPGWVQERLAEINLAYFQVFQRMYDRVKDAEGGNAFAAFRIWGPGKTAKVQCDFSAMISPRMFRRFVVPCLAEQCRWLDYSLYHLDGTNALQHLDLLLDIDELTAIEWTPQAGREQGGSSRWHDLYRRIKAGGKAVQAIGVAADEVVPLLDAVGPEGLFILLEKDSLDARAADELLRAIEPYRARTGDPVLAQQG